LDQKNPSAKADFEHLPPQQLIEDIVAKERHILELLNQIKADLGVTI
jgi:type I restriction enzyme M protein